MDISKILKNYKTSADVAAVIDHTLLPATTTEAEVLAFCEEAAKAGFAAVCVNPVYVPLAAKLLKESPVRVCVAIDFPLGAGGLATKKTQAETALNDGAAELDFVIDIGLVKAGEWQRLERELAELNSFVKDISSRLWQKGPELKSREGLSSAVTKLILETCFLSDNEIAESCHCAVRAGFDFVKTSTGFAIVKDSGGALMPNGATSSAVRLMKETVGENARVKASGGIRSIDDFAEMLEAGASRIGTSSGTKILREFSALQS